MCTQNVKSDELQKHLLSWYWKCGRVFPWRNQLDPYAVLLAEKLLQQTVARGTVINAYRELLECYPSPLQLSEAQISDLEKIIQPLGLVYRARELKTMAQELVVQHGGKVPATMKELLALTGVGEYVARAVLSFAFGEDIAIVDINVARFLYRIYGLPGKLPANPARKRSLVSLATSLLPQRWSKEFNLAILDLCALVCKPKRPLCSECPVRPFCWYGNQQDTPKS